MANQDINGSSSLYRRGTSPQTRAVVSQKSIIKTPHYGQSTPTQMGVMGTISVSESRSAEEVRGIGFGDVVAELVPGITPATTATVDRTMLYLCNLWQATGYASGISGPVRSLRHHKWPFDVELSLVFSVLADRDLGVANQGFQGGKGSFQGGATKQTFDPVTNDLSGKPGDQRGMTALITYYEGCWWTSYGNSFSKDSALVNENGSFSVTDVHDFSTQYGEFLATGNDPTIGQLASILYQ